MSVNLTKAYRECLPTKLGGFIIEIEQANGFGASWDYDFGVEVLYEGKMWNVLVDVKDDESAVFIRAHSENEFHIWNCKKRPKNLHIHHFTQERSSDYTIAYSSESERFSKIIIEGKTKAQEKDFKVSQKTAEVAMPWIQNQGLEKHAKSLTGYDFFLPRVEEEFDQPLSVSSSLPSSNESVKPQQSYQRLFIRFVLAAAVVYLIYNVASHYLVQTERLTGMRGFQ